MNEKPIERMSYFNGQRLEADDFKLEQEYHIRVRRWLNKSLYSAGIASGLEVRPDPGNPQQVIVGPGMALDNEGREIILLDEERVSVVGTKSEKPGMVEGNYLYIQYREETRAEENEDCPPRGNGKNHGQIAWGGPSRVRARPILGWSNSFPQESTGKVVLAQAELDSSCNLRHVYAYPRRYIAPASKLLVHQYALEGERHIDAKNSGRIYFHIRGHQPNSVTLFLRAEKFSSLYYTELGNHNHKLTVTAGVPTSPPILDQAHPEKYQHQHGPGNFQAASAKPGQLDLYGLTKHFGSPTDFYWGFTFTKRGGPQPDEPFLLTNREKKETFAYISGGDHTHSIDSKDPNKSPLTDATQISFEHTHTVSPTGNLGPAGVSDQQARSDDPQKPEKALTFVNDLKIYIGKVDTDGRRPASGPNDDYTALILNHLKNAQPGIYGSKTKLGEGDGSENDPLAIYGTGPIPLDSLSNNLSFSEGQYYIDLVVNSGGGRILYNLYVE
jgi:hypothetical protein